MSLGKRRADPALSAPDFFDRAAIDPELLNSGRIADPQPEHTPLFRWLARLLTAAEARLRARGTPRVRNVLRGVWIALMGVGLFLLLGPVLNPPMDFDDVIDSAELDEVDWVARDAQLDYSVDRTADGRFSAHVTETYLANFRNGPEASIERVIVTQFRGHDVRFEATSATIDGAPATVQVSKQPTTAEVRVARADGAELLGTQKVVLRYELHDLISSEVDEATGAVVDRFDWSLFAPTWPQATKGVEVSLTLPADVNDALVRAPRGSVSWLLVGGSVWLTPDRVTNDGATVYSFSNDDTLPPNADATLSASFTAGTFAQPPTTPLFWVQTYGPILPLVLLAGLSVFALAARRIVWADSAGEPWYLPRAEPPPQLDPAAAAQLLGRARHAELIDALTGLRTSKPSQREHRLIRLAQAARRTGHWGNLPAVVQRAMRWRATDRAVSAGLRWVPDSYVRDFFTFAPIAVTLVQWGLLRQLSHQVILAIVWWPVLFVLASTVLACIAIAAVHRPRPLTRAGALAMQDLKGIDVWARATRLTARGPLDDALLPYAVLFERPRRAGRAVRDLAQQETGRDDVDRGWRTERFVSGPAIAAMLIAATVLAGAIVTVSSQAPPLGMDTRFVSDRQDLPGTRLTDVTGLDITATLSRSSSGAAELLVTERLDVRFDGTKAPVPQFLKEWPAERYDQSLGFSLESVRIDGTDAPYELLPQAKTQSIATVTQLPQVLNGSHQIDIVYRLSHAAVRAPGGGTGGGDTDQVRWAAWMSFLDTEYFRDINDLEAGRAQVRPLRVTLIVAPDLAADMRSGGWIASDRDRNADRDRDLLPLERGLSARPWQQERPYTVDNADRTRVDLRIGNVTNRADGALVATYDLDAVQSRTAEDTLTGSPAGDWKVDPDLNRALDQYAVGLNDDLGVLLDFPAGTFSGTSPAAGEAYVLGRALPYIALYALLGLVVLASLAVIVRVVRARTASPGHPTISVSLQTTAYITIPLLAAAQCVVFGWTVMPSSGSDPRGGVAMAAGAVMLVAVIAEIVLVARSVSAGRPARTGRASRASAQTDSQGSGKPDARSARNTRAQARRRTGAE